MNNKNQSQESAEKSEKKSPIAASRQLIGEYIRTTFKNTTPRIKLLNVLKASKVEDIDDFYRGVLSYLSLSGDLASGPYADITEKEIREIGLVEIKNSILRESVELQNQIKTVKSRIFNDLQESSFTSTQKDLLQKTLEHQSSYDLRLLIRSKKARTNFINKNLGDTTNLVSVDFDMVCSDLGIHEPTPQQTEVLTKWLAGHNVTEKDIIQLFHSMDDYTILQKKNIIKYFLPTISLGFLLSHGILSRENAIEQVIKEIKRAYPELSDDEIVSVGDGAVERWIEGENSMQIPVDSLDDINIASWWASKNAAKELAEIIESDLIVSKAGSEGLNLEYDKNGNLHSDFLRYMTDEFSNRRTGESQMKGIENMIAGSVIRFFDPKTGKTDYIRVVAIDVENADGNEGMEFTGVASDGKIINASTAWKNYEDVPKIFYGALKLGQEITVLTSSEFDSEKNDENILPDINEYHEALTLSTLIHYLDEKDPNGKSHKFQKGYTLQYEDTETGKFSLIRIEDIDEVNREITLKEGDTGIPHISFETFLDVFVKNKFLRLPCIESDEDFVTFAGIPGLIAKDGLKMEGGSSHGDDHGHEDHSHGHAQYVDVKALTAADGKGHVLIKSSNKGKVVLQEYKGQKSWEDLKDSKIKKFDGKKALYTKPFTMDYIEFAAYTKNAHFVKAVSHNPLVDQDNYTDEAPFHMHHGLLKSFLNIGTIGDLMKAFEMSWHALEHTMEKGQKINAAKFMYRMFGKMEGDIPSQIAADYVEAVGETIEKIKKKINGFNNGMKKRNKCLHLLQDTASKPEEIAAALMVTVEGSGGLYMDNPFVGYAGSWMWFNALVRAAGYGNPATIKAELAPKVKEVNAENPTEEMYIEQFLKKYGEGENANPLLMAMGNYPKFRKALIEGRKGEMEKGERDAGELLGVGDRVQLGINKMTTLELPQVVGIYKSAMSKYAGGPADVIPWMWALSGATRIAHPNVANEFKNFTDAQGFTFHAIPFCRSPEKSDIYKRVVKKIIYAKIPEAATAYDEVQKLVEHQFSGHHHRSKEELEDYNKNIMNKLKGIWDKYGNKLHPILQGTSDDYIFEHQDDPDFKAYVDYLNETHDYRGSGGKEGFNKDYGYVDGYKKSPSFGFTEVKVGEKTLRVRDIKRELDWIRIHGQGAGSIDNELDTHIFQKSILPFLSNDIKKIGNAEQKKATYIANYQAILSWLREHLGGYDGKKGAYNGVLAQRYMQDLTELGYDLSFETVIENNINQNKDLRTQVDKKAAEDSYNRFLGNNSWNAIGEVADTQSRLDRTMDTAKDSPNFNK